jgi:hypothetical protein
VTTPFFLPIFSSLLSDAAFNPPARALLLSTIIILYVF